MVTLLLSSEPDGSLNHFLQTHPLTIIINNQVNSVLSMLQSTIACSWVENYSLSLADAEKDSKDHVCLGL